MLEQLSDHPNEYQGPEVIASLVTELVSGKSKYKNGDTIEVRDGKDKLHQAL